MKIVVLAGSPKGETSVTVQYVRYLEKRFAGHEWKVHHVASRIAKLERRPASFEEVIKDVRGADAVLWAFPLYVLLVHAGYKRFIELVFEREVADAFAGKYAATLSTSIHFHDNTAHDYVHAICDDLGMPFAGSFSPAMQDLTTAEGQRQADGFGVLFLETVASRRPVPRAFPPVRIREWAYEPGPVDDPVDLEGRRVAIVHDASEGQANTLAMVDRLRRSFRGEVDVVDLNRVSIRSNCLGCMRCGQDNHCVWEGKDEYGEMVRTRLATVDVLIYAGAVVDRHLSSRWRRFFDRGFFNTHTPTYRGKQMAFLVAGPLGQLVNLREVLTGYAQWQEVNVAGMVSDEAGDDAALDGQLSGLARQLVHAAQQQYVQPLDFRGVGGKKIFRDEIFGHLRFVFQADHRYYKKNGYYDFPTWHRGTRLLNFVVGGLFRIPRARREFDKRIKSNMLRGLRGVVEGAEARGELATPARR